MHPPRQPAFPADPPTPPDRFPKTFTPPPCNPRHQSTNLHYKQQNSQTRAPKKESPRPAPSTAEHRTPNTEHRTPNTEHRKVNSRKVRVKSSTSTSTVRQGGLSTSTKNPKNNYTPKTPLVLVLSETVLVLVLEKHPPNTVHRPAAIHFAASRLRGFA